MEKWRTKLRGLIAAQGTSVLSKDGLLLHARTASTDLHADDTRLYITLAGDAPPATYLERPLASIAQRYGRSTADLIALQLEYSWGGS